MSLTGSVALGVTVPAASRVLIPAPRRAQRFTPSGAAATCSAIALAPVAARADEHLAPASGTQKQAGIVHCSPRRGGLDDPRLPGNTALGAVRQCGSGRSLGRDRQVDVVRGCAGLPDHCDLTPTAERRHHTGAPRRHLLIGNIGSGGRQPQAPGGGTGTTQSSSAPIPQSQFTRAVRRITALSQSRLQQLTGARRRRSSRSFKGAQARRWNPWCAGRLQPRQEPPEVARAAVTTCSPATTTTATGGSRARRRAGTGSRPCTGRIPRTGTCATATATATE